MEAVVTGYEAVIAIGRACHPDLRQRGFHPTAAVGVFGAAAAAGKLAALSPERLAHAFGIAASSAGGLFAFVNGGGDIKCLHAGHASRCDRATLGHGHADNTVLTSTVPGRRRSERTVRAFHHSDPCDPATGRSHRLGQRQRGSDHIHELEDRHEP